MKHTTEEIEILERWVEALESGEYEQCRGELRLKDPLAFCCLGVLVEIEQAWDKPGEQVYKKAGIYERSNSEEYGINHYIHMNDKEKASFKKIAADIRLHHLAPL